MGEKLVKKGLSDPLVLHEDGHACLTLLIDFQFSLSGDEGAGLGEGGGNVGRRVVDRRVVPE